MLEHPENYKPPVGVSPAAAADSALFFSLLLFFRPMHLAPRSAEDPNAKKGKKGKKGKAAKKGGKAGKKGKKGKAAVRLLSQKERRKEEKSGHLPLGIAHPLFACFLASCAQPPKKEMVGMNEEVTGMMSSGCAVVHLPNCSFIKTDATHPTSPAPAA